MNRQKRFEDLEQNARLLLLEKYPESQGDLQYNVFDYYAYPVVYGSTAGPFGGLGGAAMTTFTHEAFVIGKYAVIFCKDRMIKITDKWDGIYERY